MKSYEANPKHIVGTQFKTVFNDLTSFTLRDKNGSIIASGDDWIVWNDTTPNVYSIMANEDFLAIYDLDSEKNTKVKDNVYVDD